MVYSIGLGRVKPPLGVPLNRNHKLAKGLVGCWVLNEGGGYVAYDLSGHGNDGTLTNMAFPPTTSSGWNPGKLGPALAFDDSDDHIDVGSKSVLNITSDITIVSHINASTPTDAYGMVWGAYNPAAPYNGCGFGIRKAGTLGYWSQAHGSWVHGNTGVGDGNWHWVGLSVSGTVATFYVDGMGDGSFASERPNSYVGTKTIGTIPNGTNAFNGLIECLLLYDRALTAQEVVELHVNPYCMFERPKVWAMSILAGIPIFRRRIEGY